MVNNKTIISEGLLNKISIKDIDLKDNNDLNYTDDIDDDRFITLMIRRYLIITKRVGEL